MQYSFQNNEHKDISIFPNNSDLKNKSSVEIDKKKSTFILAPSIPVCQAVQDIRYDFNDGLRIKLFRSDKKYEVSFFDDETNAILFSGIVNPGMWIISKKKYFIKYRFCIKDVDTKKEIFSHTMNLQKKKVLVQIAQGTIGDAIAWFSYVDRFQKKHNCQLYVTMFKPIKELVCNNYPNIHFIDVQQAKNISFYATYRIGLFFNGDTDHQPVDFHLCGLHETCGYILGLSGKDLQEMPPKFDLSAKRKIKEKYVVISAQATSYAKLWNNPAGWRQIIQYLKDNGYRVLCIDKQHEVGNGLVWNKIPYGCQDFTGDISLQQRVDLIKDADFFIGLTSGLSWIAWCCKIPVVMIVGFTEPYNEFYTPYRVQYMKCCHGCWNDPRQKFDHHNYLWCPRKIKDVEKFECTKMITSKMVIDMINTIPQFKKNKG